MLEKFSFNYIDIILLVVWIIAIAEGIIKGLIKQVFGILALILAAYCSFHFSGFAADRIVGWFNWNGEGLRIVAFVVTFIAVLIVVLIAGHLLDKLMKIVLLGWLNSLTGAIFGWIKWNVLLVILVYVLNLINAYIPFLPKEAFESSRLFQVIEKFSSILLPYLPFLD
ncbi:MAG TPA: CvpA family protein [Bacteroidales bacterium]|nr:MAG: Colicin V production protein [Bacteroidetes bacterium ADurb.Bin139]HOG25314.1 CvpA family protein [Bacteroidales bacterium]HOR11570.1 CvpA family protein [Bacteroidales bacterium]HOZ19768.1 CvpA family protein [Bacteroidales bacterium]HPK38766.1 CvpA family protein [Bacteroidales bacterium]